MVINNDRLTERDGLAILAIAEETRLDQQTITLVEKMKSSSKGRIEFQDWDPHRRQKLWYGSSKVPLYPFNILVFEFMYPIMVILSCAHELYRDPPTGS
ncbi:hypothetical protein KIN20_003609 [Parelaphostrongylus tenuis]|uniref:Uncharacterized protein n=1 Tax=Parelaphostrongylus tenuis TaxID=148309 RepID=A0AAD5MIJ2_PARTN|nr:hypothetical protein KIN20_003609 [Parelaphostrongylus tenuis]